MQAYLNSRPSEKRRCEVVGYLEYRKGLEAVCNTLISMGLAALCLLCGIMPWLEQTMSGLFISASGIANAIRRTEVTANNIANMTTTGFRASRTQSVESLGGGVRVGSISPNTRPGSIEVTGQDLDLTAGPGFFQLRSPDGATFFTRDGHFGLNAEGQIVNADGYQLEPPIEVPQNATNVSVLQDGSVFITMPGQINPQPVGQIEVVQFTNPEGLEAVGGNLFRANGASGDPLPFVQTGPRGIETGALAGSNVDLATEQVNLLLDRNLLQANVNAFRAQSDVLGELLDIIG